MHTIENGALSDMKKNMKKNVVLTFDDGLTSHLTFVAPLLKKYSFNGTFFISGQFTKLASSNNAFMNWKEVKDLADMGFEIGNHCFLHYDMTTWTKELFCADVIKMGDALVQASIDKPVTLAYPGFHINNSIANGVKDLGYRFARSGCEKTKNFNDFQKGSSGFAYNRLYDNPYNINCLGIFGKNYVNTWKTDLEKLIPHNDIYGIFCFHCFDTNSPVSTPKEEFISFLDYLHKNNYNVIALKEIDTQ
jgi:peptidoglycan/xylan/chitin deacetylase (PgdA/CDA1 family)